VGICEYGTASVYVINISHFITFDIFLFISIDNIINDLYIYITKMKRSHTTEMLNDDI